MFCPLGMYYCPLYPRSSCPGRASLPSLSVSSSMSTKPSFAEPNSAPHSTIASIVSSASPQAHDSLFLSPSASFSVLVFGFLYFLLLLLGLSNVQKGFGLSVAKRKIRVANRKIIVGRTGIQTRSAWACGQLRVPIRVVQARNMHCQENCSKSPELQDDRSEVVLLLDYTSILCRRVFGGRISCGDGPIKRDG